MQARNESRKQPRHPRSQQSGIAQLQEELAGIDKTVQCVNGIGAVEEAVGAALHRCGCEIGHLEGVSPHGVRIEEEKLSKNTTEIFLGVTVC